MRIEVSTTIARPLEEVWTYLADANHLDKLIAHDPGDEIKRTSEGALGVGSTLELKGEFRGRKLVMGARISEYEANRGISIEYISGPFRGSKKTYTLEPSGPKGETKITHVSIGEFHGAWRLMAFLLRPTVRKGLTKSAEEELAGITNGLAR